jgi:CheY-like chemotaxis protein
VAAKGLIVRHDATLNFASSTGSTDDAEGRAVSGNKENAGAQSSVGQREKEKLIGKRIAIVDDEEDLCFVVSMLIRHLGYDIECIAHGGDEIVQAVMDGKHPDVIIMDYRMPGMNGLQVAEMVLKEMPNVKITIASADDSIRQATLSAGLSFLPKPFSVSSLARLLENLLSSGGSAGAITEQTDFHH